MYETFYGMREKPFSLLPDPAHLYLSKQHQMAMTLLEYCLEHQAGFSVITGDIGTGKTTLIRYLLNQIGEDISVGLISNTHQSFDELLRWILPAFDLEAEGKSKAAQHRAFSDYLISQYAKNKRTMLIVDEAQNMSPAALEELRMLSNINSEKDLVLQVMLVGQPGLRKLLQRPELEQLTQRVAVDYHLKPLNCAETHGYIRHRVTVVGGKAELFSDAACDAVFRYSGGTPRLINLLCDLVLVYAYAGAVEVISGDLVDQVVRERQANGALQIFSVDAVPQEEPVTPSRPAKTPSSARAAPATHEKKRHLPRAAALEMRVPEIVAEMEQSPVAAGMGGHSRVAMAMKFAERNGGNHRFGNAPEVVVAPPAVSESRPSASNDVLAVKPEEVVVTPATTAAVSPQDATGHLSASDEEVSSNPEPSIVKKEAVEEPMSKSTNTQDLIPVATTASISSIKKRILPLSLAAALSFAALGSVWWFVSGKSGWTIGKSGMAAALKAGTAAPESTSGIAAAGANPQSGVAAINTSASDEMAQLKLSATERERDAALAMAKALERERNAALEAAKLVAVREQVSLREQTAASEYKAALAKEALAEEQGRTYQALIAAIAEKKLLEEQLASEAAVAMPVHAPAQMSNEAPNAVASAGKVAVSSGQEEKSVTAAVKTDAAKTPSEFTADPCKGPAARFLSTCK